MKRTGKPRAPGRISDLLEPRVLSNLLFDQNELFPSTSHLSGYVYAFGQFLSHDLQETRSSET